jgi:MFS family permease
VGLLLALWAFFVGFNLLEATLPSLISRLAPAVAKGSAIGVYSTAQFLGAFCGGAVGGLCYARYGASGVFVFAGVGLAVWLLLIATMPRIRFFATHTVDIGKRSSAHAQDLARRLSALTGVAEAIVVAEAGVAYLKVDPDKFDEKSLKPILGK